MTFVVPLRLLLQNIIQIIIQKRNAHRTRLSHVELRIGNTDCAGMPTGKKFTHNNKVGSIWEGNEDSVALFHVSSLAKGRFLTVQKFEWGFMEIDEITVGVLMVAK